MGVQLYTHLTWTTLDRASSITATVRDFLDRFLRQQAIRYGARPLAMGMVNDHVHMIVELPPAYDLPTLLQGLKGASARIANRDGHTGRRPLQWTPGYDARSVRVGQLAAAIRYVESQASRHPTGLFPIPGREGLQAAPASRAACALAAISPRERQAGFEPPASARRRRPLLTVERHGDHRRLGQRQQAPF